MKREFIRTATFDRSWIAIGLGENELRELEDILLKNPISGVVIPHLSGARKVRFAPEGRSKSGGVRIIYIDIAVKEQTCL